MEPWPLDSDNNNDDDDYDLDDTSEYEGVLEFGEDEDMEGED